MASEFTSFDLLLTAAAIGIAVWTQVVDSPRDKVDSFENRWLKLLTATSLLLSLLILLTIFLSLTVSLFQSTDSGIFGAGGTALYLVLLAVCLTSIPTGLGVFLQVLNQASEFEEGRDSIFAKALVTVLGIVVIVGVWFVTV